jgi:hypothetical protein
MFDVRDWKQVSRARREPLFRERVTTERGEVRAVGATDRVVAIAERE